MQEALGPEDGPQASPAGPPRPLREGHSASARKPRADTASEESEGTAQGESKGRKGRNAPRTAQDGLLGFPVFNPTPQPVRAAQAASASQLKGFTAATATKVTGRAGGREPADAKPSAPETGDLSSHRPGASPSTAQVQAASAGATSVAELATPPPVLPAPLVQAALDLPALHLSILPHSARLSVSTEEGDVQVQLRVKDSVANVRVEGPGAAAFQRAPDELRVTLAQAGLSLGSFELSQGDGQQRRERQEPVVPFEPEVASAGFVTRRAADSGGTEGEKAHPRQVRVRA